MPKGRESKNGGIRTAGGTMNHTKVMTSERESEFNRELQLANGEVSIWYPVGGS